METEDFGYALQPYLGGEIGDAYDDDYELDDTSIEGFEGDDDFEGDDGFEGDEDGDELGATRRRRRTRRAVRTARRAGGSYQPPKRKRTIPVRDNILNVAGVADAAKNVTIEHTAKTDYWLTKALFDGSTAGMLLSSIQVGEHVIWQDQSGAGLPVSAFVAAAQNSFALGGKRLQRNEQLLIRAVAASSGDTLRVQFGVKQRIAAGRC